MLLAYQDAATVERVSSAPCRAQGYAYDDLEFADDMRCVSVPVREKDDRVTDGISLSGPASRYTLPTLRELRDCAIAAARELSHKLGGA